MKASVLILTFNEEINIRRCIESLVGVDDIVVIDSGSTDATREIARELGARVLTHEFKDFADQRNFGLECGSLVHEWVLHLDADEALTAEFCKELARLVPSSEIDGWQVPSKTILDGRWLRYAGMYPTFQVRLSHRDRLRFKQVGHGQREDCPHHRLGRFPVPYLHFNFSHGLTSWFVKHIKYAKDEAVTVWQNREQRRFEGRLLSRSSTERRRAIKSIVSGLPVWTRPPLRFLQVFFLRRGFMDGRAGLQYALMLSAYEAMIAAFVLCGKERTNDTQCNRNIVRKMQVEG